MSSSTAFLGDNFQVQSSKVQYTDDHITSRYTYISSLVQGNIVRPVTKEYIFKTERNVPKTGVMLVGWGGNNGSTLTAGLIANKHNISWNTKDGVKHPNFYGSLTQSSTVKLGLNGRGQVVYTPLKNLLPMVNPSELIVGGWDISSMNLGDAMVRSKVIEYDLQQKLMQHMINLKPLPSVYYDDFIAANQNTRADNVLPGTKQDHLDTIRRNIRDFRENNKLDKVIVLWTANTERFCDVVEGINDTADNLLLAIKRGESEVSPSTIFSLASILEGCPFVNGSPQNTFVPGVLELAERLDVPIAGDDFKTGQTKLKSSLVDMLVGAGIKPISIASYNHLGNNDGYNLSSPLQFRSKEISKSGVMDDMVASNRILYAEEEKPDHCVVIKFMPNVGDSKRAMDEYSSEIFMNGKSTIVLHNTCEDSLLAAPLILDLIILAELSCRIQVSGLSPTAFPFEHLHPVLSLLSYLLKAPVVPPGAPVVNALGPQRQSLVNLLLACLGLPPDDNMLLEYKVTSELRIFSKMNENMPENGLVLANGHRADISGNGHGDPSKRRKLENRNGHI